jgi:hypothetical protein
MQSFNSRELFEFNCSYEHWGYVMKKKLTKSKMIFINKIIKLSAPIFLLSVASSIASAKEISFENMNYDLNSGLDFSHVGALNDARWDEVRQQGLIFDQATQGALMPFKSRGAPGVAIFDYDQDGDKDIYVSNGTGANNGLFANQLSETGSLSFIDLSEQAGVSAQMQNSTGLCYGDIDNDGDQDLLVLAANESNRYFENLGNGTFIDHTLKSGLSGDNRSSATCSMGDINGDGLLDIAISNTWNSWDDQLPLSTFDFDDRLEHNQLFVNQGNGQFLDQAPARGLNDVARISWSIAIVDYDLDGDADVIVADDQGPRPPEKVGGQDRGFIRIYQNDGKGQFTNITTDAGMIDFGAYMSLSLADLNHDGNLDIFASNVGDYLALFTSPLLQFAVEKGEWASTWFLQNDDGVFAKSNVGELSATPFGWGAATVDYDNDGDSDIIYHGGESMGVFIDASNPGVILNNDGNANFTFDDAISKSSDHSRRNVEGMAVGDLNNDGFTDIVSVSSFNWASSSPVVPYLPVSLNSVFDETAFLAPSFIPVEGDPSLGFLWTGLPLENGDIAVDISSGNDNQSIKVDVIGTIGLIPEGKVNRNGFGAVIKVNPAGGQTAMVPVMSGGTYASSHSTQTVFGLGNASTANIEILWPGGVKNKYYFAQAGENVLVPEIPCSFDDQSIHFNQYKHCVVSSLRKLLRSNVIDYRQFSKLMMSALFARFEASQNN